MRLKVKDAGQMSPITFRAHRIVIFTPSLCQFLISSFFSVFFARTDIHRHTNRTN